MTDFLLELRSEEIPARMQAGARVELEKLFRRELDGAGVPVGDVTVWSTPRRLALIARELPEQTEAVSEEAKGPPEGAPDQAVEGFCRKNGVTRDQLEVRDVKGRPTYFAVIEKPGRAVADLLASAIPAIIRDFSWPKSMRWGDASISTESLRWVRPLSGIVALLGDTIVECEVYGVTSGAVTLGHRFHHSGDITIGGAGDYAMKLRAAHVIVDHEERQNLIRTGAAKAATDAGLKLVEDEGLVVENAGLTEWPIPLLGRFEDDFLEVPPETIQLTARVNQKYFVCEDAAKGEGGKLANAFICTANIEGSDGGAAIVDGNRKVLAARLSDARFFWDVDRKKKLEEHARGLERITFHEKLGTVADKVERVAKLARWLVEEGIVAPEMSPRESGDLLQSRARPDEVPAFAGTQQELADQAEQAARLCKADLVTEMVGEFPELQGLMGGYYARAEGLPDAVADAIRDHYKPVGQGDEVPFAPVTIAVSLADKLDSLFAFFTIGQVPTGSKDPFALRRAALGVLRLVFAAELRLPFISILEEGFSNVGVAMGTLRGKRETEAFAAYLNESTLSVDDKVDMLEKHVSKRNLEWDRDPGLKRINDLLLQAPQLFVDFITDRLKVQQREAGVRHDLIDAVFALGGEDDLVRLLARVHALQSFIETEDGTNLLAGYKRAANILKKEDFTPLQDNSLSYTPEPAEKALGDALDTSEPQAAAAIEAEDFAAAMTALAALRSAVDIFFEEVTVNADEPDKRAYRLGLLTRFRDAVQTVADFSRIEG